ncbi:PIN-like domain-containing protein, partial [Enterobacter kobei]
MKEQFAGFYGPSENEIDEAYKDPKTMFIFDTNILLSLYRCEETTRTQFLDVWRNLKDQVWIPFHVCLEYQRNRLIVIQSA